MNEVMEKVSMFERELSYIKNQRNKENASKLLSILPDYFFRIPASTTGKYHPSFALGDGGLVRHTKVAVRIAYEILENECLSFKFTDQEKDLLLIALMLHDGCKTGVMESRYTIADHPLVVSRYLKENQSLTDFTDDELGLICSVIETHSGPWNMDYKGNVILEKPSNRYQRFVHMCDYLASRKFLDVSFVDNEIEG